jgi:hypothetical protein
MDPTRFDTLTKRLATEGFSRRRMLRGLGGGLAGAALAAVGLRQASADNLCKPSGYLPQSKCNKDAQCCSGRCAGGQCCTPTTCAAAGKNCGTIPDGCGGTLTCGACTGFQTCGGGGTPNVCGCTPTTCAAQGVSCGTINDGCGGTLNCGSCSSCAGQPTGAVCGAGGVGRCDADQCFYAFTIPGFCSGCLAPNGTAATGTDLGTGLSLCEANPDAVYPLCFDATAAQCTSIADCQPGYFCGGYQCGSSNGGVKYFCMQGCVLD